MNQKTRLKVDAALDKVRGGLWSGSLEKVIALSYFPTPNIPSAKWSLRNRILMGLADTIDARGYRQWIEADRQVLKGSRSFSILGPYLIKKPKTDNGDTEDDTETQALKLVGFHAIPVFRAEDTDGADLDYDLPKIPDMPFKDVADRLGVTIKAGFCNHDMFGSYSPGRKLIRLNSPEPIVFFHELVHAAHSKVESLESVPKWRRETIAELGACVLGLMAGMEWDAMSGQAYQYIKDHANGKAPGAIVYQVLGTLEKVLGVVFPVN